MEISAPLAADLAILNEALDDPEVDLTEILLSLARTALDAVNSYIGLSVLIEVESRAMTLTAFQATKGPADVATSLSASLPLSQGEASAFPANVDITLVLFAAVPGAFVDMAADLEWLGAGGIDGPPSVGLDKHLDPVPVSEIASSLGEYTVVNQAIGALIGQGKTPEQAEHQLVLDAARNGADIAVAAAASLARIDADRRESGEV